MSNKKMSYLIVAIIFIGLTLIYNFAMGDDWGWTKWGPLLVFSVVSLISLIATIRAD